VQNDENMNVQIFNKALQIEVIPKKELRRDGIPIDVWTCFEVGKTLYKDISFLLLKQTVEQTYTPKQLKYLADCTSKSFGMPVVFVFDEIPYYQRVRLFDKNVYFIVNNNYVFLPNLFINTKVKDTAHHSTLTATAQYLLLFHLQKMKLNGFTATEIAERTPLLYTTITRAITVLVDLGLCEIEKDALRFNRINFSLPNNELYDLANRYFINPIKSIYYCDDVKAPNLLLSNISALSRYTMINDDEIVTYAIDTNYLKSHKNDFKNLNPIEGNYRLEVWQYPPIATNENTVDKISLVLSLQDNDDPRIKKEVLSMIEKIW
jgi:hypothetical protein